MTLLEFAKTRVMFWLTLATIITAGLTARYAPNPKQVDIVPGGFESPTLALELARTPEDAATLINQARDAFRKQTMVDFVFIAAYTTLWFTLARRRRLVAIVPVLIVLAGLADVSEDVGILQSIAGTPTASTVALTYWSSMIKWTLLGVTWLAFFPAFKPSNPVRTGWDLQQLTTGLFYAYAGTVTMLGVIASHTLIERSVLPLSAALLLQLFLFLLYPAWPVMITSTTPSPAALAAPPA